MICIQALTGLYPTQLREDSTTGEIQWQNYAQVNPRLAAIISQMVRYDYRQDRFQSATEVLKALEELANPFPDTHYINNRYVSKLKANVLNRNNSPALTKFSSNQLKIILAIIGLLPFIIILVLLFFALIKPFFN